MSESRCIALLGSSQTSWGWCVCLVLQSDNAALGNEGGQLPVYHCLSSAIDGRCMLISPHLVCERKLKWKLKDVYIALRPAYREGSVAPRMSIARLMASSPQRPYHFTPAAVGRWERDFDLHYQGQRLVLSDVHMPPLPWTGSSPVVLLFQRHRGSSLSEWITLTLGNCTVQGATGQIPETGGDTSVPHTPSPKSHPPGKHYAIVHYGSKRDSFWSPDVLSCASTHSCEHDHLELTRPPNYSHSPVYTTNLGESDGLWFRLEVRRSSLHPMALVLDFYPLEFNPQRTL